MPLGTGSVGTGFVPGAPMVLDLILDVLRLPLALDSFRVPPGIGFVAGVAWHRICYRRSLALDSWYGNGFLAGAPWYWICYGCHLVPDSLHPQNASVSQRRLEPISKHISLEPAALSYFEN